MLVSKKEKGSEQMPKVTVIQPTLADKQITKQRCAAYCRVSSVSMDQLNSFYAQTRYYSQIFENSETEQLVDVYADEGITGTREDKRDEFQRMMKDCRKGKIDRIYTKSISRFSRNTRDCLKSIRELKELGVTIYFEKENIDTADITDEVMITIMGGLAQEESTSISNNMRWSIQHRMKSGTMKPPNSPFGYKLENGTLNVDNQEAKVVKQIFGWYLMGYGSNIIAKRLNDMKIVNNGKVCHWTSVAVRLVLRNEKYVGDQLYQKNYTTDTLPFKRMINRGEYPQYYYTDMHQPIISREEFEMVQKILHDRERFNSGISHKHILAKKSTVQSAIQPMYLKKETVNSIGYAVR